MLHNDINAQAMARTEKVAILGATGSIGSSTLDILENYADDYEVYAVSGHSRVEELFEICKKFQPKRVAIAENKVDELVGLLNLIELDIDVVTGQQGLVDIARDSEVDTVVASIVGSAGLDSTLAAVKAGKRVLLANKESLVMAGDLLMDAACESGAIILPVDSEHNAIFQCLPQAVQQKNIQIHESVYGIRQLWLTASGGPFLNKTFADMQSASVEEAVAHPNWSMGQKISIDSATMMNKGLELIEACYLFDLPEDKINVAIHPQSVIHSMVEYVDGSILAQMGTPDMRTPIAHCLAYPHRIDTNYQGGVKRLNLFTMSHLQFIEPDFDKFVNLKLARQAMKETQKGLGNWANISLNASNEVAVSAFLQKQIRLTDIANINQIILEKMSNFDNNKPTSLEDIMNIDTSARRLALLEIAS